MPIAYQEQAQLSCPACGADFEAPVWLILDAQEQPVALEALLRDELNLVCCPSCGQTGPAGAPLIFHDGLARRVIFAPAPGSADHEVRDQARDLHALLVGSIPEAQRRPYLADVDIAQDLVGVAHLLRRLQRRRGDAASPAAPRPQPATAPAPAADAPPLLVAVESLLAANTADELTAILAAHPILLDPSTDATLAQLVEVARQQRAFEVAESLSEARALLARMASAPATTPATLPPSTADPLPDPALQALLRVGNAAELAAVAQTYPTLLTQAADLALAALVEAALDDGDDRLALTLEERREALVALRTTAPIPPDAASLDEAIEALLIAEGEVAIGETIERYPVLLDDLASQALWQFAAEARASGDEDLAGYAIACRDLLRRIRGGLDASA
ncbi:MAG: CpXC domain-containing protein [Oscillochloridaceae bacterium umkhey_bin13]